MQMPAVTVVIPVKNEERYIKGCLQGLANQTYPDELFRIIVVDNGSTDATVAIVESFRSDDRLQLLVKKEGTIAAVRNYGAAHATGEIIAFLDGDCVPAPDWLETGVRILLQNRSAACVGFVGGPPEQGSPWVERTWHSLCSTGRASGTVPVSWLSSFNLIMWRELFQNINGFDATLATCEDADLGYRLSLQASLLLSDESMVMHLDDPKTLGDFFLKELWRGKSSIRNFLRSPQKKRDLLSVAVPIIYLFILLTGILAALSLCFAENPILFRVFLACLVLAVLVPIMNVFYKTRRLLNISQTMSAVILSMVYLFARGLVIVRHDR